jgi:hypothetical protein
MAQETSDLAQVFVAKSNKSSLFIIARKKNLKFYFKKIEKIRKGTNK